MPLGMAAVTVIWLVSPTAIPLGNCTPSSLLVVSAWVHGEGLDIARRRFPRFADRVAKHPAGLALARGLRRMGEMVER